jgi:hypothetical protein
MKRHDAVEQMTGKIDSSDKMILTIRHYGIIPFFRNRIIGWSIEELTDPGYWFYSSDNLGPWDWKIDAVREGDIAYGKFLGGKAAFATVEWYRHLMNWRRSLQKYRLPLGEKMPLRTGGEKVMAILSPIAFDAITENGSMDTAGLRQFCGAKLTPAQLKKLPARQRSMVKPTVRKNLIDSVMSYLEMGTWTVIGDFRRVYRGPNLEYTGWQRCSYTTPDALFGIEGIGYGSQSGGHDGTDSGAGGVQQGQNVDGSGALNSNGSRTWAELRQGEGSSGQKKEIPFWAKILEDAADSMQDQNAPSPEDSRQTLISHILSFFPDAATELSKII